MPLINARDIAFGRLQSPDLDLAEEFLTEFGMIRVERTNDRLYMRGTDPTQYLHVTHKGEPKYIGFGWFANSEEDLKRVAAAPGASGIEHLDEPGGGQRVRLTDPSGYQVEVVYGIAPHKPIPVRRQEMNQGDDRERRAGELMRIHQGRSRVKRMGHAVVGAPDLKQTVAWYREHLGLLGTDEVYDGSKDHVMGSFNRVNRGPEYVDHHTFFCLESEIAGLNHFSFEVADIDDVFTGHEHLKSLDKYEHMWGLGRHVLGSQIYDYWADPWGRVHEHWSDSDRINAEYETQLISASEGLRSQWGEPVPQKFIDRICP